MHITFFYSINILIYVFYLVYNNSSILLRNDYMNYSPVFKQLGLFPDLYSVKL